MSKDTDSLVLKNAHVWTGDASCPSAEAVAMAGGVFTAVGNLESVRERAGRGAREIDLGGRLVAPGFIDSHVHLLEGGKHLLGLDLSGADTPEEFIRRIRERVAVMRSGEWITGGRWETSKWPGGGLPHRGLIDGFSREVPILVQRTDGHIALANSRALEMAGITRETDAPKGGVIDRDEDGEPTGILRDAAMGLVRTRIAEPGAAEKKEMIRAALAHAASLGVTSVVDLGSPGVLPLYAGLADAGELTCRMHYFFGMDQSDEGMETARSGGFRSPFVRVCGVKAFVDGSLGARTALMYEPYEDERENRGLSFEWAEDGRLEELVRELDDAGLQAAVHAIGDRAVALVLDIFGKVASGNVRHRVEHAQHLRREEVARFGKLGVIASVQPAHILLDAPYIESALGKERAALTYAFGSLAAGGTRLAFGTDWPVVGLDPVVTLHAAVTREPLDGSFPGGLCPEERVGVEEALSWATLGGAYALGVEGEVATIAPGKLADAVVLSEDVLSMDPSGIHEAKVDMTIVGGRVVHRSEDLG